MSLFGRPQGIGKGELGGRGTYSVVVNFSASSANDRCPPGNPAIDWPRKSNVSGLGTGIAHDLEYPRSRAGVRQRAAEVAGQEVLEERPMTEGEGVTVTREKGRSPEVGHPQIG